MQIDDTKEDDKNASSTFIVGIMPGITALKAPNMTAQRPGTHGP